MPRAASSGDDVAIEQISTTASCPWNFVDRPGPRVTPKRLRQRGHLQVVGRDDPHVLSP